MSDSGQQKRVTNFLTTACFGAATLMGAKAAQATDDHTVLNNDLTTNYLGNLITGDIETSDKQIGEVDQYGLMVGGCRASGTNAMAANVAYQESSSAYIKGWVWCQSGTQKKPFFTAAMSPITDPESTVSCASGWTRIGFGCGIMTGVPVASEALADRKLVGSSASGTSTQNTLIERSLKNYVITKGWTDTIANLHPINTPFVNSCW